MWQLTSEGETPETNQTVFTIEGILLPWFVEKNVIAKSQDKPWDIEKLRKKLKEIVHLRENIEEIHELRQSPSSRRVQTSKHKKKESRFLHHL